MSFDSQNSLPKILIAEDNLQTMALMRKYLQKAGNRGDIICEICEAHDGEATIQKIIDVKPEIILCDIGMPKKDGFEVLDFFNDTIKSRPFSFFAFCSSSQEERIKAFKLGVMGFISKQDINYYTTTLQLQSWIKLTQLERRISNYIGNR